MNRITEEREAWLARLLDLLPSKDTRRVRAEVEAMIADRVEGELARQENLSGLEAQQLALEALGDPELLAERLVDKPLHVPLTMRRFFARALAVLFSGHLLLSIVLTVAGAKDSTHPTLLGPIPTQPASATLLAVVGIFLLDAGAVLTFLWITRQRGVLLDSRHLPLPAPHNVKNAWQGLVLVALFAVILNWFVESIFAIRSGLEMVCFLSTDVRSLLPWVNVLLALQAVRCTLVLLHARPSLTVGLDALGSILGAGMLVLVASQPTLVTLPTGSLGPDAAATLGQLLDRVLLFVCVMAALYLVARGVRRVALGMRLLHA